jgi:hypothetical protein
MVTVRRVCVGVACFALLAGFSVGTAKEKEAPDPKKVEETTKIVQDIATANDLIKYGYDNKMPTAIITGVQMLSDLHTKYKPNNDPKRVTVEKADPVDEEAAAKAEVDRLKEMLEDAKKMPAAKAESIANFAEFVKGELGGKGKGTAAGYTCHNLLCQKGIPGILKVNFYAGLPATISVTKVKNDGVPISVTVTDSSGQVVLPIGTNRYSYNFRPTKLQTYTVTVAITQGGAPCTAQVITN